jgi:hypothetical protein
MFGRFACGTYFSTRCAAGWAMAKRGSEAAVMPAAAPASRSRRNIRMISSSVKPAASLEQMGALWNYRIVAGRTLRHAFAALAVR